VTRDGQNQKILTAPTPKSNGAFTLNGFDDLDFENAFPSFKTKITCLEY